MKRDKKLEKKLDLLDVPEEGKKAIQHFFDNMHYLRKEFFKDYSTVPTKFISEQTGLSGDQLWRLDNNLSGTIPMFLSLMYFYHKYGINLNEMFYTDIKATNTNMDELKNQLDQMDELMNE